MPFTKFGPGTFTLTIGGGTEADFSGEVKAFTVNHEYEDVGESTTYLDGSADVPGQVRADSITVSADFDLTAAGLYSTLFTNDSATAAFTYVPNTVDAAQWSGSVVLRLPEGVAAESFGAKLGGDVTLPVTGTLAFTPAGGTP